jgi:hypothetical protein
MHNAAHLAIYLDQQMRDKKELFSAIFFGNSSIVVVENWTDCQGWWSGY